jgi:hypothetical protein
VQETAFSYDVLGRYVCNDWLEVETQQQDGGFPFVLGYFGPGCRSCDRELKRYDRAPGSSRLRTPACATVMVQSAPFVEYLHLARFGERWLIVNALYYVLV